MPDKKLTGRIAADRIRMQSTPKPPAGAVGRFLPLGECTMEAITQGVAVPVFYAKG